METDIRHRHEAPQAAFPQGTPLTLLQIGEAQTAVAVGDGSQAPTVLLLAIGSTKTATDFFHHAPPTPREMETAIMVVEDEVTRVRAITAGHSRLYTHDAAIRELALLAGVPDGTDGTELTLSLDAVERLFDLLAALSLGRPASSAGIPATPTFAATLLILREFMHHLQWASISYRAPA
ncbi:MAG: hypothetical protein V4713_09855 [Pseudomonadota bacterium]